MIKETREKYLQVFFWQTATIVFILTCLFIGYGNFLLLYEKDGTSKNMTNSPDDHTKLEVNLTEIEDDLDIYNDPLQEIIDLVAYILMPYVIPMLFFVPDLILIFVSYIGVTVYAFTPRPISNLGKHLGDLAQKLKELYDHSKKLLQIEKEAHTWLPAVSWLLYLVVAVTFNIHYMFTDDVAKVSRFNSSFLYECVRFSGLISIFWSSLILTAIFESLVDKYRILNKWFKSSREGVKPFRVSKVVVWVSGVIAYSGSKLRRFLNQKWDKVDEGFFLFGGIAFVFFLWILLPMIYHLLEKMGIEIETFATLFGLKDIPPPKLEEDIDVIESILTGHMNHTLLSSLDSNGSQDSKPLESPQNKELPKKSSKSIEHPRKNTQEIHQTTQNQQSNENKEKSKKNAQKVHQSPRAQEMPKKSNENNKTHTKNDQKVEPSFDSIAHYYSQSVYI